jgi:hypothetical protein
VQTNDNQYGDLTYNITVSGTFNNLTMTKWFTLTTTKNCGFVELTPSSFAEAIYYYPLTGPEVSFSAEKFNQTANGHETEHCYVVYEVKYRSKGSSDSFTSFVAGMTNTFVSSFDSTTDPVNNTVAIYSVDIAKEGNWEFKIVATVDPCYSG